MMGKKRHSHFLFLFVLLGVLFHHQAYGQVSEEDFDQELEPDPTLEADQSAFQKPETKAGFSRILCFYICDDPVPSGIKLRLGIASSELGLGQDSTFTEPFSPNSFRFPLVFFYEENVEGESLYQQPIFDFAFESKFSYVGKRDSLDSNKLLTENERRLIQQFPLWGMQVEQTTSFIMAGNSFGFFTSRDDTRRFGKFGLGYMIGIYTYDMTLSFCQDTDRKTVGQLIVEIVDVTCESPIKIDETRSNNGTLSGNKRLGIGAGGTLHFTFYENYESDSVFAFFSVELLKFFGNGVVFKRKDELFPLILTRTTIDLFSYVWLF